MIPAVLIIMLGGAPMAQIEGFAVPSACNKPIRTPRLQDKDHRPVTALVRCTGRP